MALPVVGLQAVLEGTDSFERDANSVSKSVTDLGSTVLKIGGIAAGAAVTGVAALGAGLAALGGSAVSAAADVGEMESMFGFVFQDEAEASRQKLDEMAAAMGRNKYELEGFAAGLQSILVPMGLDRKEAAATSIQLTGLAEDLSSFYNVTESDALAALKSALVGESEPMRRFGVVINEAAINQEVMNSGLAKGAVNAEKMASANRGLERAQITYNDTVKKYGAESSQARKAQLGLEAAQARVNAAMAEGKPEIDAATKAQAILNIILRSTKDAQGDAERTSGSWVNQMRALNATIEETKVSIGRELLPVLTPLLQEFTNLARQILPEVVKWFADKIIPIIREWGAKIPAVVEQVKLAFADLQEWLRGFIPMIQEVFGDLSFGADIEWHEYFPSWLADAIEWLIQNLPLVKGALEGIGAVLLGAAGIAAIAGITGAILALANPITALIAAGALLGAAWETNWMGMRDILTEFWERQAKPALEDLVDWLKVNVPRAIDALVKFWEKDLLPALITFSEWVKSDGIPAAKEFEKWVTTKLIPAIKDLIKWIEAKLVPVLVDLAKSLGKAQSALSDTSKEMTKTGGTFDKLADFWAKNGDKIKKTTEDVFNYVASQIKSKLQVAQDTVAIVSDVMAGDWGDAWKRMQSLLDNALNAITLGITGKMKEIGQTIGKSIASFLSDWQGGWNKMSNVVGDALNRISQTIGRGLSDAAKTISDAASAFYNAAVTMMSGLINGVASQASSFTSRVISTVQGAVSSLLSSITSGSIYSILANAGRSIITVIQGALATVTSLGSTLINVVANAVASLVSSVVSGSLSSTLRTIGQTIVNLISAAVATVTSLASALLGVVSSAIAGVVNSIASGTLLNLLRGAGGAIIDGLVEGIEDNADAVADTLSNVVNAAIAAIKAELGIPGDPGPSRYMAAVGSALMRGYSRGIMSQAGTVSDSMQAAMMGAMGGAGGLTLAPSLVAAPGYAPGGVGGTTVNNWNLGGNNITNGMDQAVFEARVLQVIRRNLR